MMWKAGVLRLSLSYVTPPPRPEAVSETNKLPTTVNTTMLLPQATQARFSNTRSILFTLQRPHLGLVCTLYWIQVSWVFQGALVSSQGTE